MEETKGVVSRIWQNETRGGKPYWVLSIQTEQGEFIRYSVWNWKMLEGIHEGDMITYKFQQKGNYNNITEILRTEKLGAATEEMLQYQMAGRLEQIARMSAIKSATQLLSTYDGDPKERMIKTLETAKEFEKYIFGTFEEKENDEKPEVKSKKRAKKEKTAIQTRGSAVEAEQRSTASSKPKEDLPF